MKKNLIDLTLIITILIISVLAIASAKSLKTDKEVRIFQPSKSFDRFDAKDVKDIIESKIASEGIYKRVIADDLDENDIRLLKNNGCLIKHKLKHSTSFECPEEVISKLKVREARVFYILDLEADQQIKADQVWAEGITGEGVDVVILDTGIDDTHIELSDNILSCENFVSGETCEDLNGHGTHVAGIITANGVYQINSNKATGVSPGAGIYMLKVCNANGLCYEDDMMAAMEYAVANIPNARIMSISIGGGNFAEHCDSDPLAAKVNWAVDNGFTVAVAAGNDGKGVSSPACASKAIAVGAVDKSGIVPWWSNRGSALDIVAPGVNILSTYSCLAAGDCSSYWYAYMSGTSMSTPHVAGVLALLSETNPTLTDSEIKNALYTTADPVTKCYQCTRWSRNGGCLRQSQVPCTSEIQGAGIVNAYEAYLAVKPTEPPIACYFDIDCDDTKPCTQDICVNPGIHEAYCSITLLSDGTLCDDDQFCTIKDVCTFGVCLGTAKDCSDEVTCTTDSCDETNDVCINKPDNSICDDGLFCNGAEICGALLGCQLGIPINCDDNNECTTDSCNENIDACEYTNAADNTPCTDGICCSGTCTTGTTECISAVKCWSADYQYLYRNNGQAKKFCKCAQGNYGYNSYSYTWSRKTVYQYIDSGDNENWEVTSRSSYLPIYKVKCIDGNWYTTNQDYYFG